MIQRYPVLNIWCDAVSMQQAMARVVDFVEYGSRTYTIFASNPEKNFSVPDEPMMYDLFRTADLLIPDGVGMVLATRFLYGIKMERVPGCELMQNICALSSERGYKIFLYGSREEVNRQAVEKLRNKFPGIRIVGRAHGYLQEEAMPALVETINESGASILFLALGSPKQEQWISHYGIQLSHVRVCQGIGGTLDVITGTATRAPELLCRAGLEWLYRLISEPKRLKRQMVLPLFALQVLRARLVGAR
jgi:N-acetylglucosaminyldiphosphoundecaprenol N-acetyl-beta-D-mannosaminyltransferase